MIALHILLRKSLSRKIFNPTRNLLMFLSWALMVFSFNAFANSNSVIAQIPLTVTLSTSELKKFNENSPATKRLIEKALNLAKLNLVYQYGSANPAKGGMDCSGTIQYLLKSLGLKKVPRQANTLYRWVWLKGQFYAVNSFKANSFEYKFLKPGDLLFWNGTYSVKRDPPVTHVMLYLGETKTGQKVMFGASNGRSYHHRQIYGVSVFDFYLPKRNSKARFIGYSCIPDINCE